MLALFALCLRAAEFRFDDQTPFFPPRFVPAGETVTASAPDDSGQAIFLWQAEAAGVAADLALAAESGLPPHLTLSSTRGVRVAGGRAALNFTADVRIQAWLVPAALCPGPVLFYSAPAAFTDDLRPLAPTEFCAFFAHARFRAAVGGRAGARLFSAARIGAPAVCNRSHGCTFESTDSSFLSLQNIERNDRITLEVTAKDAADGPCERAFIPLAAAGAVRPLEMPLEPADLFSCAVGNPHHLALVVFAVAFMALVCIALLVLFGWCSAIQRRLRVLLSGSRDVNRDIDPKQLLREDQIQNLISIVPECEEEDAGDGAAQAAPAWQRPARGRRAARP
jgi:hypothetical protein